MRTEVQKEKRSKSKIFRFANLKVVGCKTQTIGSQPIETPPGTHTHTNTQPKRDRHTHIHTHTNTHAVTNTLTHSGRHT